MMSLKARGLPVYNRKMDVDPGLLSLKIQPDDSSRFESGKAVLSYEVTASYVGKDSAFAFKSVRVDPDDPEKTIRAMVEVFEKVFEFYE